jgi:hypothetical protein
MASYRGVLIIAAAVEAIVACAVVVAICGWTDSEPIGPDQEFELQFGRGSGWHGLDLLRVASDGRATYEYQPQWGTWIRKTFVVDIERMRELRAAVNDLNVWGMQRAYSRGVADGTQWIVLIRVEGKSKSVYFDNKFPVRIKRFADYVDNAILKPLADPVEPIIVPTRLHGQHTKEIWASIKN